jgi:hypothetical protein
LEVVARMIDPVTESALLEYWASRLRGAGFVVIPRERHVVLHASYLVTRREMENSRIANRLADAALEDNLRCLIRKAFNDGLLLHERRENDERDTMFTTLMGVIKPKEDDEA